MKTTTQFWNIRGKFLATCLFAVWLLFLNFNTITAPFQRDEGEYAYSAQLLRDGGTPYKESFMQKPPMIIYTYYLAQTVSENVWTPRALALLFIFLTGLILADLIRKEYDNKSACAFLALFPALLFFRLFRPSRLNRKFFCFCRWRLRGGVTFDLSKEEKRTYAGLPRRGLFLPSLFCTNR